MLTVTEDAKAHLATLIDDNNIPGDKAIRLIAGAQGIGLAPDTPADADETFDHDGRTVLCVEPRLCEKLDGRTLSIQNTEQGAQLSIA